MLEVKIPEIGESITEVTLVKWLKSNGDYVEMDEPICEVESDKATFEINAEAAGKLETQAEEDQDLEVGDVIAKIDTDAEAPAANEKKKEEPEGKEEEVEKEQATQKEAPEEEAEKEKPEQPETYAQAVASPAAAKLMREHDLDKGNIEGSGKDGRITKADVEQAIEQQKEEKEANGKAEEKPAEKEQKPFSRNTRKEKMSRRRRTIAQHLVVSKNERAMLTTFNEVNMQPVMEVRSRYKQAFAEKYGVKLGFMGFFTRACCLALQEFPAVNGIIEENHIVYHDYCDIGIAVSTPRGLVVPVIRNAESLELQEIEKQIADLATRGRDNKLGLDEMKGGTFTISNGGVFGSLLSTPILNAPQSAILGMHKIEERPVVESGKVLVRPMMYLAVSYDHRIIDGKQSVSFLMRVKEILEHPEQLLAGKDPVKQYLGL